MTKLEVEYDQQEGAYVCQWCRGSRGVTSWEMHRWQGEHPTLGPEQHPAHAGWHWHGVGCPARYLAVMPE